QAADRGDPKSRNVILGNEQSVDSKTKEAIEDADAENRANLKAAGVNVIDRLLGKGSIPHNKFMVLNQNGGPVAVLSGSTNWTSTGSAAPRIAPPGCAAHCRRRRRRT